MARQHLPRVVLAVFALGVACEHRRLPSEPGDEPTPHSLDCAPIAANACEPPTDPSLLGAPGTTNLCWEPLRGSCPGLETSPPVPGVPGYDWVQVGRQVLSDAPSLEAVLADCSLFRADGSRLAAADVDFTTTVVVLEGIPTDPAWCHGAGTFDWIADDAGAFVAGLHAGPSDCDALAEPPPTLLLGALVESAPLPIADIAECPRW